MNFADAVKTVLTVNYANFNGRSARPEYWWFTLFSFIVNVALIIVAAVVPALAFLRILYGLAVLIPGIAVGVRRLHDLDKSGWWLLIAFTVIGAFVLLYWFTRPGTEGANRFGASEA